MSALKKRKYRIKDYTQESLIESKKFKAKKKKLKTIKKSRRANRK